MITTPRRPVLIPHWRRAWRMLSVQLGLAVVAWGLLPPEQQAGLLALVQDLLQLVGISPHRLPALLGLVAIASRLLDQPAAKPRGKDDKADDEARP